MATKIVPLLKVTKSSSDGSIVAGECVWYSPVNGSLVICGKDGGLYDKDELTSEMTDFEFVEHPLRAVLVDERGERTIDKSALLPG